MQRAPCGAHNPHDDPDFKTTKQDQEERLDFIAKYTDAMVRATVLNDRDAASFLLNEVASSHLVRRAKVSSNCLLSPHDIAHDHHTAQHAVTESYFNLVTKH